MRLIMCILLCRSGEIGIRTRLKIWRTSLFMSVRVLPPAPLPSSLESWFARIVPQRRHVDHQLEIISNFAVDEDLINNGLVCFTFYLQANIAHGHRSVSVNPNATVRISARDCIAVSCRLQLLFRKSVPTTISDKVIECALKVRSKVVRKQGQRRAEEYPPSLAEVIQPVKEIYGGSTIFRT